MHFEEELIKGSTETHQRCNGTICFRVWFWVFGTLQFFVLV